MSGEPKSARHIVFVCTGNCIRSQMAEGLLRRLAGDRFRVGSAGVHPAGYVHEQAIEAMDEMGIDIGDHVSKGLEEFAPPQGTPPDVLVTLCDYAAGLIPKTSDAVRRLHWPVDDPITARGTKEERLEVFRWARDRIRERIGQALRSGELDRATDPQSRPCKRNPSHGDSYVP